MSFPEDYESSDHLRETAHEHLSIYMFMKVAQEVIRRKEEYIKGTHAEDLPEAPSTLPADLEDIPLEPISDFQFSTLVEPGNERFGYALALSPLTAIDNDSSIEVKISAVLFKVDREKGCLANDPLEVTATGTIKPGIVDEFSEDHPGDSSDYESMIKLLEIGRQRFTDPSSHEVDPTTRLVVQQEFLGQLALMYGDKFANRASERIVEARSELLEARLKTLFDDEEVIHYREDTQRELGRSILPSVGFRATTLNGKESYFIVSKEGDDYIISILDCLDALSCRRFAIGPFAEDKFDKPMDNTEEPTLTDIENLEFALISPVMLSKAEFFVLDQTEFEIAIEFKNAEAEEFAAGDSDEYYESRNWDIDPDTPPDLTDL